MSDAFENCAWSKLLFTKAILIIFKAIHDTSLLFSLFNMVNVFVFISGNRAKNERERERESHMNDYLNSNKQWIKPKSYMRKLV